MSLRSGSTYRTIWGLAFAEDHGGELPAFVAVFAFEVGADEFAVAGGVGAFERSSFEDVLDLLGVFLHPLEVVVVVGGEADFAAVFEDAVEFAEERGLDAAAFVVSFFWPGVGEVDVDASEAVVGDEVSDKGGGVGPKQLDVGELMPADAVGGVAPVGFGPFDAEEVDVGFEAGLLDEEGAFARADFEVHGSAGGVGGVVEPLIEVERAGLDIGQVVLRSADAGDVEAGGWGVGGGVHGQQHNAGGAGVGGRRLGSRSERRGGGGALNCEGGPVDGEGGLSPTGLPIRRGDFWPAGVDLMSDTRTMQSQKERAKSTLARLGERLAIRPGPLVDLLGCDGTDPQEVQQIIGREPSLTARVLGVVNSAGCRRGQKTTSINRAVLHLGAGPARTLGLAMGMLDVSERWGLKRELLQQFWNASMCKAEAAHLSALAVDESLGRTAHTMALMSDIGLPLLMALDPDFYTEVLPFRSAAQSWSEAERAHFGIDHGRAGAHLLQGWGVSAETVRWVGKHHELPSDSGDAGLSLALYVAGLLPHGREEMLPAELDGLMAVHGRLLHRQFASPDAFLGHVYVQAHRRMNRDLELDASDDQKLKPYLDAVASNTIALVAELHQVRRSRSKEMRELNQLRFEAFTDPLTKVLNRRGFFTLAAQRLTRSQGSLPVCCMLLDLNGFKPVNDKHGHEVGDLMLRGLAKMLRRSVSRQDLIGRLGGDEFVLMLTGVDEASARAAAGRVLETSQGKMIRVNGSLTLPLQFSMGVSYHEAVGQAVTLDQLIASADERMYAAKRARQAGVAFARYEASTRVAEGPSRRAG